MSTGYDSYNGGGDEVATGAQDDGQGVCIEKVEQGARRKNRFRVCLLGSAEQAWQRCIILSRRADPVLHVNVSADPFFGRPALQDANGR